MVHYKNKAKETADVTTRYYLSDAVFLVGLESDDSVLLEALDAALRAPAWPLYLGRRSCPPTPPLVLGVRALPLDEALWAEPWQASDWHRERWARRHPGETLSLPVLTDADGTGFGRTIVQDVPVSFDQRNRQHDFRAMEGKAPAVITPEACAWSTTEHDAFAELGGLDVSVQN